MRSILASTATSSTCALHPIPSLPQAFGLVVIFLLSCIINSFVSTESFPSSCKYAFTLSFLTNPFPDTIPPSNNCCLFTVHSATKLLEGTICTCYLLLLIPTLSSTTPVRLHIMHYWNSSYQAPISDLDLANANAQFSVPVILDLQLVFDTIDSSLPLFSRLLWLFLHVVSFLTLWVFTLRIFCRIPFHI